MTTGADRSFIALMEQVGVRHLDADRLAPVLQRFLDVARRYGELEQMTLGAVPLQFPAHLLLGELEEQADAMTQGAHLAGRERERLGLTTGGLDRLHRDLENQGVKIIEVPFPENSALLGAFTFDESFGPAILVDASRPLVERQYAICHEYGHFLADNDPYRSWICRTGGAGDCSEELRAHAFAGAFLVPPADLRTYLRAAGVEPGAAIHGDLVRQLRVYFQADDRAIIGSLLAGGYMARSAVAPLLDELRDHPAEEDALPEDEFHLSLRYIGLAVLARRRGRIDATALARYLETDQAGARRIEKMFDVSGEVTHGQRED